MQQVAVFVDAGYAHAAGTIVITGSNQPRAAMELNTSALVAKLAAIADEKANGARLLRIYWYDGLLRDRPSLEQENLARMDNVKVRLGTVTAGQQKGVDSLVVTDLIELARNHAITDAVLLSGDEDLRIGVQIAQGFGVRVHLLGIEPSRGNQSNLLRQEADTTSEWSKSDIQEFLANKDEIVDGPELPSLDSDSAVHVENVDDTLERIAGEIVGLMDESEILTLAEILGEYTQEIPYDYDRRLLGKGRGAIGRNLDQSERLHVRVKFREIVASRRA